jgi:hypothetical protein
MNGISYQVPGTCPRYLQMHVVPVWPSTGPRLICSGGCRPSNAEIPYNSWNGLRASGALRSTWGRASFDPPLHGPAEDHRDARLSSEPCEEDADNDCPLDSEA